MQKQKNPFAGEDTGGLPLSNPKPVQKESVGENMTAGEHDELAKKLKAKGASRHKRRVVCSICGDPSCPLGRDE
jgi:hypothetical protein